jgi:hypothetical protein
LPRQLLRKTKRHSINIQRTTADESGDGLISRAESIYPATVPSSYYSSFGPNAARVSIREQPVWWCPGDTDRTPHVVSASLLNRYLKAELARLHDQKTSSELKCTARVGPAALGGRQVELQFNWCLWCGNVCMHDISAAKRVILDGDKIHSVAIPHTMYVIS